jgi:hypothetical protein
MSLNTTATNESERTGTDLVEKLIEDNRYKSLRFIRLAKGNTEKAERYYNSLPANVQDYIRYSPISQSFYNRLFRHN